jgi:4-hydroxy 2-oxovalerate aldolase
MQSNDRSEKEIRDAIECIEKVNCVSIIYFADSLGKMTPAEISDLVQIAKKYWKKDLGIHTHDNKGLALSNTIEAIKNGIKWVDSTILGMGRGAGNVQTEMLLAEFETLKNK